MTCAPSCKERSEDVRSVKKLTGTLHFDSVANNMQLSADLITIQCKTPVNVLSCF